MLIEMINSPSLPMTRWIALIQLFSFKMVHVPGESFTMPYGLSRRPPDLDEEALEFDEEQK